MRRSHNFQASKDDGKIMYKVVSMYFSTAKTSSIFLICRISYIMENEAGTLQTVITINEEEDKDCKRLRNGCL